MQSLRWSCQSALAASRSPTIITNGSRRAFSLSSVCRRGALPQFLEPSTPELSALLAKLNSKVLLPEHLTADQQKLVYRKENRARLEAEPIEITLGDVTLPLEHIDRNTDRPSRWHTLRDVVDQSESPEDWENVVRMMEGYESASIHVRSEWQEKIIRNLNKAGMQHLVLKALQRADKTGLRLRKEGVTLWVFLGLHDKAIAAEWEVTETKKALGFAEQIIELMEGEHHLGKKPVGPGDLRTNPFVIGIPLELAAVRAKKHTSGQDKDGKVKKYASRLMGALQQDRSKLTKHLEKLHNGLQAEIPKSRIDRQRIIAPLKRDLLFLVPLWNALRISSQVLKTEMPQASEAQKLEKSLKRTLTEGRTKLEDVVKDGFAERIGHVGEAIQASESI